MSLDQKIFTWLGNVQDNADPSSTTPEQKRPRDEERPERIQKRRRLDSPDRLTSRILPSTFRQSSSAKRQLLQDGGPLAYRSSPIDRRTLGHNTIQQGISTEPSLETLTETIHQIRAGIGILPCSGRRTINELKKTEPYRDWNWAQHKSASDKYFSTQRDDLGDTPPSGTVHKILSQAAFCESSGASQADWNVEVIHRILDVSLRPANGWGASQLVDFRLSTTATIIPNYFLQPCHREYSKKADFCIYAEPSCDKQQSLLSRIIKALRNTLPQNTLNHIDLNILQDRPIALGIQTLGQDHALQALSLHKGDWISAQWNFLEMLLSLRHEAAMSLAWMQNQTSTVPPPIPQLPKYLFGIIVQGHEWYLVTTAREQGNTALRGVINFGSTASAKGIYQIICTLQVLKHYVREVYWPWMRDVLLNWPRKPPSARTT
ncbi:hypothetical protein FSARC_11544 [Fusarium sarcochroum]|uniref:PD-(D/E)XK nuclease-like domain-containing protein n=1 Tax=Fusarium sarcochroum TaxID=1208366 RepID=A0A8H4TEQ5_9HYPO|nr:hypothetical protein FSARC_11544 [Fusarium sarcochroum]